MNEEIKKKIHDKYLLAKQKGVKFYPDIVYKDLLVSFAIFLLLVGLATFVGVTNEPKADPNDSTYIPRPEWYFLFLFEFLKFIPGSVEWLGTTIIPLIGIVILFLLPFIDKNPSRYWKKRKAAITIMSLIVLGIVGLTIRAVVTTPAQPELALASSTVEKITQGQDLYSVNCVECHGADGEGGEIIGVQGLEGTVIKAIHSQDVMYTRTDETIYKIIDYGQPNLKMQPFGKGYGGQLSPGEIEAIVTFMRYTWDDRVEVPKEAQAVGAMPVLKSGGVASYETDIAPIVKRYCVSCHRSGKTNVQNYMMETYEQIMTSGDHAPNVVKGDLKSNLIRMIHREKIEAGNPMPQTKSLPKELIDIFDNWVLNGTLEKATDAANITAIPSSESTPTP
jgi:ubiquinol-cytochrome c reductase cytochrome b subunit